MKLKGKKKNKVLFVLLVLTIISSTIFILAQQNNPIAQINTQSTQIINNSGIGVINVSFKEKSGENQWSNPVTIDRGNYQVTIQPVSLKWNGQSNKHTNLVNLNISNNIATYPCKFNRGNPGTECIDLRFIYYGYKLKEEIVFPSLNSALDLKSGSLGNGDVLTFKTIIRAYNNATGSDLPLRTRKINFKTTTNEETNESIYFVDSNNITIFEFPKAKIYDSNGNLKILNYTFDITNFGNLNIRINVPYEWLANETIVYPVYLDPTVNVEQDINFISYSDSYSNINITLYKKISGNFENNINDLFIYETPNNFKFSANDTTTNETTLNNYKYKFVSDKIINQQSNLVYYILERKNSFCGSLSCFFDTFRYIKLNDICNTRNVLNSSQDIIFTFEPNCNIFLNNSGINSVLTVDFLSNSNIDPQITITDVSVADSILTNITTENNFTHLSISNENFLNTSNVFMYQPFDVNSTSAYDYTGQNFDGVLTGGVTWNETGYDGGGYDFDGVDGEILWSSITYDLSPPTNFTTMAWIRFRSVTGSFMTMWEFANDNPWFGVRTGAVLGCHPLTSSTVLSTNTWYHVAFTYAGATCSIYIDGTLDLSGSADAGRSNGLGIGHNQGDSFWDGSIDEFIYINETLSATQIADYYNKKSSLFFATGTQEFQDNNVSGTGSETFLNITINSSTNFDSMINVTVGNVSGTGYDFGSEFSFTNNFASDIPIGTPNNISIKFIFYAGNSSTNTFKSPTLQNDVLLDSFEGVVSTGTVFSVNVSQGFTGTTQNSKIQGRNRAGKIYLIITSSIERLYSGFRSLTQTFSITTLIDSVKGQFSSISQSLSMTTIVETIQGRFISIAQPFLGTFSVERLYSGFRGLTQSLSITALLDTVKGQFISVSQNTIITTLVQGIFGSGGVAEAFVRNVVQNLVLNLQLDRLYSGFISLTQTFPITTLIETVKGQLSSISQSFSLTALLDTVKGQITAITQPITLSSSIERLYSGIRDLTQTFSITALIDTVQGRFISLTQTLSITTLISETFTAGFDEFTRAITQSFDITAILTKLSSFSRGIFTSFFLLFGLPSDEQIVIVGENGQFPLTISNGELNTICTLSENFLLENTIDGQLIIDPQSILEQNNFLLEEHNILLSNIDLGNILPECSKISKKSLPKIIPFLTILLISGLMALVFSYRNKKMNLVLLKRINNNY